MKWLDRLLGEPPEPRGLYVVPGVPPPVPREVAEGRRGTCAFPEAGLPEGFKPPSAALAPPADYED